MKLDELRDRFKVGDIVIYSHLPKGTRITTWIIVADSHVWGELTLLDPDTFQVYAPGQCLEAEYLVKIGTIANLGEIIKKAHNECKTR